MRIIAISASRIPSETANSIQIMKVCQALTQLGHEVKLVAPDNPQSTISEQPLMAHYGLTKSFPITYLPARSRRLFPWYAARHALSLHPDALYVWPIQAAVLGLLHRLPVILEMHDLPSGFFGPLWYILFLLVPGKKRMLVITHALQNALEKRYSVKLSAAKIRLAPNGVDLERFTNLPEPAEARRQLGLPSSLTVACTGHLYAGRGVDLFLILAKNYPQIHFLWVGGRRQDIAEWQNQANRQELTNVTFKDFIPNEHLPLYQSAADILLMPYGRQIAISSGIGHSSEFSSPMKMFEYLASGRAIVTSDFPIIREILNEDLAVFCPPDDRQAWISALGSLIKDSKRRQALGLRASLAAEKYTWIERATISMKGFEV